MASIYKAKTGIWIIDVDRFRRLRVGKNKTHAAAVHRQIELIEDSNRVGLPLPPETIDWIRNIDVRLRKRLVKFGLISEVPAVTIGDLCLAFETSKTTKADTRIARRQDTNAIREYFKVETPLIDIRTADALAFKSWLLTAARKKLRRGEEKRGLSQATVSRRIKTARSVFKLAVDSKWIASNPFHSVVAGKQHNSSRSFFVTRDMAKKILEELPSVELRLVFALGRWGGMRVPSEVVELKWSNIDWARRSMTFRVPKTEHIDGKETRTCPIFTELAPFLNMAYEAAPDKSDYCCPALRKTKDPCQTFTKFLVAAIVRSGLKRWPRLLVNLRATRATEIGEEFGSKAESEWIGHGVDVALRHYMMVTDEKWEMATGTEKVEVTI